MALPGHRTTSPDTGLDARMAAVALADLELAGLAGEGDEIFRPAS
jgi:hypothetical protein